MCRDGHECVMQKVNIHMREGSSVFSICGMCKLSLAPRQGAFICEMLLELKVLKTVSTGLLKLYGLSVGQLLQRLFHFTTVLRV